MRAPPPSPPPAAAASPTPAATRRAVGLSPLFPETLMIGLEIREKVSEFVRLRIAALRREAAAAVRECISVCGARPIRTVHFPYAP